MSSDVLGDVEKEIDQAFANNALTKLNYSECLWTLLSVAEDHYIKFILENKYDLHYARMYVDSLLNELTYPLRICFSRVDKKSGNFNQEFIDEHYNHANKWLIAAKNYRHFCSIFPLYHNHRIDLRIDGTTLIPTGWSSSDLSYEAYDRLILRRNPENEVILDPNEIADEIVANTKLQERTFSLKFNPKLSKRLIEHCNEAFTSRYTLPESWAFQHFTIGQFKTVFCAIQSLAYGWALARKYAIDFGVQTRAYASALWMPEKTALCKMITRYTGIQEFIVAKILKYLTFGDVQIRNPDIAIQPLVDLLNGRFAISPAILMNVHSERNICVLFNQIPEERSLYSRLVDEKENCVRDETVAALSNLGLDFRDGQINGTNIDLALIDHARKKCLCIEIKWFIEPAEIREVLNRCEELEKGTSQANKIYQKFLNRDPRLMELLGINEEYDFLTIVGSMNFIGHEGSQHPDVPIIKLWHLTSEIGKSKDLGVAMEWLRERRYLPKMGRDYKVITVPIKSGKWESFWYGIAHVEHSS